MMNGNVSFRWLNTVSDTCAAFPIFPKPLTGYKHASKIGFQIFAENLVVRFSPSFACNKLVTMLAC